MNDDSDYDRSFLVFLFFFSLALNKLNKCMSLYPLYFVSLLGTATVVFLALILQLGATTGD